jgi:hypothetical protein
VGNQRFHGLSPKPKWSPQKEVHRGRRRRPRRHTCRVYVTHLSLGLSRAAVPSPNLLCSECIFFDKLCAVHFEGSKSREGCVVVLTRALTTLVKLACVHVRERFETRRPPVWNERLKKGNFYPVVCRGQHLWNQKTTRARWRRGPHRVSGSRSSGSGAETVDTGELQ